MKKSQKQAVVHAVKQMLPNFNLYKDIALVMLTKTQLESLKNEIGCDILGGCIEYRKSLSDRAEVMAYARSMVMNHLKKAKELNGNQIYGVGPAIVQPKASKTVAAIDMSILSDDLSAFIETLM